MDESAPDAAQASAKWAGQAFEIGDWTVDPSGNRLIRGADVRPLRFKAMALLMLLAEHAGQTVARELIVEQIWDGNEFVAPKAINNAIWAIRQALGDDSETPRYLETIPKKGYRLIAPVRRLTPAPRAEPSESPVLAAELAAQPGRSRMAIWAAATVALLLVLGMTAFTLLRDSTPRPRTWSVSPLSQYPGHEFTGALSPDGKLLAFGWWQGQGQADLYLRAAADLQAAPQAIGGGNGDVMGLSWSPDGQSLVYAARATPEQCRLWIVHLKQGRRELAKCEPLFTLVVAWSPRGDQIAFTGRGEGPGDSDPGLFLISPEGGTARRLTRNPPPVLPDHQPAWSPDGQRLAFARTEAQGGSRDLHELDVASGRVRRLSQERLHALHGITYDRNGQDLIYATTRHDSRMLMHWDRSRARATPLGLEGSAPQMSRDGQLVHALLRTHVSIGEIRLDQPLAAPKRLIGSVASDRWPDVSAVDGRLAFSSRRSGAAQIWIGQADADSQWRLTQLSGLGTAPAWSPDARALVFQGRCGEPERAGLCLMNADGTGLRALAADGFSYGPPFWSQGAIWAASNRSGSWQLWRFAPDGSQASALHNAPTPADSSRVTGDARRLIYQATPIPAAPTQLVVFDPVSSSHQRIQAGSEGAVVLDWALHPEGLLALTRSDAERFELSPWAGGPLRELNRQPLGSFPETARFSLGPGGRSAFVELSNLAYGDLMLAG